MEIHRDNGHKNLFSGADHSQDHNAAGLIRKLTISFPSSHPLCYTLLVAEFDDRSDRGDIRSRHI